MAWYNFWKRTEPTALAQLEPPKAMPPKAPGGMVAVMAPLGEGLTQHPGWGLTADTIRGAFVQAEQGYPALQCDVFDDVIERDAHLRSLVEGRTEEVAGKQWILQSGGDGAADDDAARALEQALRRISNVHHAWEHLLSANLYGYAGVEIEWDRVDGLMVPVWLGCVPHRRFRFDWETDEPRLLTKIEQVKGEPLTPGKWIFAQRQHRKAVRAGLLRTATWWAWMKGLSIRDWQIFCTRFGIPFVLGLYKTGANEEEQALLRSAIRAFGLNGGAALPEGTQLEVKDALAAGGSQSVHPAFVDLCNSELSKLILGATLTSGEGSSAGSYALGAVHQQRAFSIAMGDEARLGHWVSTQLGEAFVRFNGLAARPPRLRHRVVPEVDPMVRMQMYSLFANELGGEIDEDQIRDEFDLKRPSGNVLKGTKKPDPAAAPASKPPAAE